MQVTPLEAAPVFNNAAMSGELATSKLDHLYCENDNRVAVETQTHKQTQ
jgi:hypothetical protein